MMPGPAYAATPRARCRRGRGPGGHLRHLPNAGPRLAAEWASCLPGSLRAAYSAPCEPSVSRLINSSMLTSSTAVRPSTAPSTAPDPSTDGRATIHPVERPVGGFEDHRSTNHRRTQLQPPTEAIPSTLVEQIIHGHERDGISFFELHNLSALHPAELSRMVHNLKAARLIEARADGRLYPRTRRRKLKPAAPTFLQRLARVFRRTANTSRAA